MQWFRFIFLVIAILFVGVIFLFLFELFHLKKDSDKILINQAIVYGIKKPIEISNDLHNKNSYLQLFKYLLINGKNRYKAVLHSEDKLYYCEWNCESNWWLIEEIEDSGCKIVMNREITDNELLFIRNNQSSKESLQ